MPILKQRIDAEKGNWVLDGAPREKEQVTSLNKYNIKPQIVIILDGVKLETVIERYKMNYIG